MDLYFDVSLRWTTNAIHRKEWVEEYNKHEKIVATLLVDIVYKCQERKECLTNKNTQTKLLDPQSESLVHHCHVVPDHDLYPICNALNASIKHVNLQVVSADDIIQFRTKMHTMYEDLIQKNTGKSSADVLRDWIAHVSLLPKANYWETGVRIWYNLKGVRYGKNDFGPIEVVRCSDMKEIEFTPWVRLAGIVNYCAIDTPRFHRMEWYGD